MAFGRYEGSARGAKATFLVTECLLHFSDQVRADMVVAGLSMDQVRVFNKGIAYKRNNGTIRESRHKRCTVTSGSNHVDNGSTDNFPAGGCGAIALS